MICGTKKSMEWLKMFIKRSFFAKAHADEMKHQSPKIVSPTEFNTAESMNTFFSDIDLVKRYAGPERLRFYVQLLDELNKMGIIFEQQRVLDVGCGTGHLLKLITEKNNVKDVVGLDFSEEALKVAHQTVKNFGSFYCADVYQLEPANYGVFDIVLCTEVLEHLLHPEEALQKLLTLLSSNGILVLTVPNGRIDNYDGHINFWSPESWQIFITKCCPGWYIQTILFSEGEVNLAVIRKNIAL